MTEFFQDDGCMICVLGLRAVVAFCNEQGQKALIHQLLMLLEPQAQPTPRQLPSSAARQITAVDACGARKPPPAVCALSVPPPPDHHHQQLHQDCLQPYRAVVAHLTSSHRRSSTWHQLAPTTRNSNSNNLNSLNSLNSTLCLWTQ